MSGSSSDDAGGARLRDLLGRSIHDLRNPLAVVRASLEWLELELAQSQDLLDAVRDAGTATTRMLFILEDLATLSRLESHEPVTRSAVELGSAIERVVSAANAKLDGRGIKVVMSTTTTLEAQGDARLLERAIEALLDACTRGAPPDSCVEVAAHVAKGGAVEITIGLRGASAKDEVRAASIEALSSGGLGVYLALRIVEAHGGTLAVATTTTVPRTTVRLPA